MAFRKQGRNSHTDTHIKKSRSILRDAMPRVGCIWVISETNPLLASADPNRDRSLTADVWIDHLKPCDAAEPRLLRSPSASTDPTSQTRNGSMQYAKKPGESFPPCAFQTDRTPPTANQHRCATQAAVQTSPSHLPSGQSATDW